MAAQRRSSRSHAWSLLKRKQVLIKFVLVMIVITLLSLVSAELDSTTHHISTLVSAPSPHNFELDLLQTRPFLTTRRDIDILASASILSCRIWETAVSFFFLVDSDGILECLCSKGELECNEEFSSGGHGVFCRCQSDRLPGVSPHHRAMLLSTTLATHHLGEDSSTPRMGGRQQESLIMLAAWFHLHTLRCMPGNQGLWDLCVAFLEVFVFLRPIDR